MPTNFVTATNVTVGGAVGGDWDDATARTSNRGECFNAAPCVRTAFALTFASLDNVAIL